MNFRISKKVRAVIAVLLVLCTTVSLVSYAAPAAEDTVKIQRLERLNPVYWAYVEPGTALEDTGLPETLRAVFDLSEFDLDAEDFVQTEPEADMSDGYPMYDYYSYGYVRPDNSAELYAAGEPAIYSVYYDDPENPGTVGEIEYRIYGSIADYDPCWFTCDEEGNIGGVVQTVEVTWDGEYDGDTEGTYDLTGELEEGVTCLGEDPYAEIIVTESADEEENEVVEIGGESVSEAAILNGYSQDMNETGTAISENDATAEDSESTNSEEEKSGIETLNYEDERVEKVMTQAMELYMPSIVSVENPTGTSSSSWADYVNTIWWNKAYLEFEWTDTTGMSGVSNWSNGTADLSSTTSGNTITYTVTSGDQFRATLVEIQNADSNTGISYVVEIQTDINLRGYTYNWTGIDITGKNVTIHGNDHIIYNFGQYNGVGFFKDYDTLTITDLTFETAKMITLNDQTSVECRDGVGAINGYHSYAGILGRTLDRAGENPRTFDNVNVNDSLIACLYAPGQATIEMNDANPERTTYGMTGGETGTTDAAEAAGGYDCYVSPFTSWSSNVYVTQAAVDGGTSSHEVISTSDDIHSVTACSVNNCYVYGGNHVNGFSAGASNSTVKYCYSQGNLICGTGRHSAGFVSCNVIYSDFSDCFAANEFYGTYDVAGFVALSACCNFNRCYSTGKVEGYHHVGGFAVSVANVDEWGQSYINDCYSTALVSLRSGDESASCHDLAGFYCQSEYMRVVANSGTTACESTTAYQISNSYAAGEVGNFDTDNTDKKGIGYTNVGGFISSYASTQRSNSEHTKYLNYCTDSFDNCFYDKQTTAMREWIAGDINTNTFEYSAYNYQGMTNLAGVTGVLTTTTEKAGTGLASGEKGDSGYTGLGSNWVETDEHYPQLIDFNNATATQYGSQEKADLVKAYSRASTATVFLDTWDTGYDWDEYGVRSSTENSYNRTLESLLKNWGGQTYADGNYKGYEYTYDTVREIISDFTVTGDAYFSFMINSSSGLGATTTLEQTTLSQHKAGVGLDGDDVTEASVYINNRGSYGTVNEPGVQWYEISESGDLGQVGYRPIRLIAYMYIDAGDDRVGENKLHTGDIYDHRDDVKLALMSDLASGLVVGWDDDFPWATAYTGGYPDSDSYFEVLADNLNEFSYAGSTRLWTEIWVAKEYDDGSDSGEPAKLSTTNPDSPSGANPDNVYVDEDGNRWQEDYAVAVTGDTAEQSLLEEQTWNGERMFKSTSDGSANDTYIVSYYYMLADGRYINDYKVISLEDLHDTTIQVKNYYDETYENGSINNSANSEALDIGGGIADYEDEVDGKMYEMSGSATDIVETKDIDSGTNVTFGWQKDEETGENYVLKKIQVDYNDTTTGETLGTWSLDVTDIDGYNDLMTYFEDGNDEFTIKVTFETTVYEYYDPEDTDEHGDHYETGTYRESIEEVTAWLTYKISYDNGTVTLTLDKFSDFYDNDYENGYDSTDGIVINLGTVSDPDEAANLLNYATLDDLFCDVTVTLWVAEIGDIPVYKIDSYGVPDGTQNGGSLTSLNNIKLLDGAGFAIYAAEDITVNADGTLTIKDGAEPVSYGATADLTQNTDAVLEVEDGLIIFNNLEESNVYYIIETNAPSGYELLNPNWWQVTLGGNQDAAENYLTYQVTGGGSWYLYTETVTDEDGAVTSYTAAFIPNTRTSVMLYKIDGSDVVTDETTGDVTDYTALGDASFILSYTEGDVTYYYSGTALNGELQWTEDVNEASQITSAEDGAIALPNLDPGTYQLQEVTAPDGYLVLSTPWDIVVDEHGNVTTNSEYSTSSEGVFIQMVTSSSKNTYSVVYVTETDADEGVWTYTDENGREQTLYMNPSDGLLYVNANFSGTGYAIMQPTVWYIPNYATYELPSAAGSGLPLIWYFAGGMALMVAGAWIWLRRWKRGEVDLN